MHLNMANTGMTSLEAIEFLNLEGLNEVEKNQVLACLQFSDSVQLPWIKKAGEQDIKHNVNNNATQEYYENCYQYPPYHYALNSPGAGPVDQHSNYHPVMPPTQYTNCYTTNITTPTNGHYVYPTQEFYCYNPYQQIHLVPSHNYYVETVSCVPNITTTNSYVSSSTNNTYNVPSAETPSSNTFATNKQHENQVASQNGSFVNSSIDHVPNGKIAPPPTESDTPNGKFVSYEEAAPNLLNGEPKPDLPNGECDSNILNGESSSNESNEKSTSNEVSPVAPQPTAMSWASLFKSPKDCDNTYKKGSSPQPFVQNNGQEVQSNGDRCPIRFPTGNFDPVAVQLAEYLVDHTIETRSVSLQPRGLLNKSNYCYINSILQALLACPQVYHLFKGMNNIVNNNIKSKKNLSTIDRMCQFIKEFSPFTDNMKNKKPERSNAKNQNHISITCGTPFEPTYVHKMLNGKTDSFQIEGRQEDAEEFLCILLNTLNDEMSELISLIEKDTHDAPVKETVDDKEWQVMGGKKRPGITRKTEFRVTPISNIFGGLLKSRIQRNGDQPTDNIQPFFTLQLNIEKVKTVIEALEALSNKIQLEGVICTKTNKIVDAWQQTTIDQLPEVLILHLKCFDYRVNGCTKIIKMVEFPIELRIDNKLLSSSKSNLKEKDKQYKLFAIVYHDGKEASKGHYFTDAYHSGYGTWLRYDDAVVNTIQEEQVLKPQGNRVPYLLFYRRSNRSK